MSFETWQWAIAVAGALLVGLAKTGVPGLSMLFIVMFAAIMPAKASSGLVLPLLICGDIVAVASYRRHTQWHYLWRLFPWTALGVVAGYFAMSRIDDRIAKLMIGFIVVSLVVLHLVRSRRAKKAGAEDVPHPWWFAALVGVLAGFTTLVANAAGPLMTIYLLSMKLPKMEFVGTGAVYFFLMNCFKVPFMMGLGSITWASFSMNLWLFPAVIAGAFAGKWLLGFINQKVFEQMALWLSLVAGLKLLFF